MYVVVRENEDLAFDPFGYWEPVQRSQDGW